jgi:hypothetical protein
VIARLDQQHGREQEGQLYSCISCEKYPRARMRGGGVNLLRSSQNILNEPSQWRLGLFRSRPTTVYPIVIARHFEMPTEFITASRTCLHFASGSCMMANTFIASHDSPGRICSSPSTRLASGPWRLKNYLLRFSHAPLHNKS